jgi:hypothetical protein
MSGGDGAYVVAPLAVPPPPPGPGVQAPFVAPPTDGVKRRRGWAIGLSIGTVLVLCLGGVVGVAILLTRVVAEQAEASVTRYLTALRDANYDAAYGELCDRIRISTSRQEFEAAESAHRVTGFDVGGAILSEPEIVVPATVESAGGSRSVRYQIDQDDQTGALKVCGEAD